MRIHHAVLVPALVGAVLAASAAIAQDGQEDPRADRMMQRMDADGDGRISRAEWQRRPGGFNRMDADQDGFLTRDELRSGLPRRGGGPGGAQAGGGAQPGGGGRSDRDTACAIARMGRCDIALAVSRGLFETGLRPKFADGADCRDIDEGFAIDYSGKRSRKAYHGGIDMPAPWGTPIVAAADGEVVAVYGGEKSSRGMEIVLRHSPQDTGLPFWTYTQYAHFSVLPKFRPGDRVKLGQALGPTGNSGIDPRSGAETERRRPAIHFAVFYGDSDRFSERRDAVVPENGRWMDPVAFYRAVPPWDSAALKALPETEKQVPIPYVTEDGKAYPAGTKRAWPYTCSR